MHKLKTVCSLNHPKAKAYMADKLCRRLAPSLTSIKSVRIPLLLMFAMES
jgi:hypothetical protein